MLGDLFGLEFVGGKRGSQGIMDPAPESHIKEFKFHKLSETECVTWVLVAEMKGQPHLVTRMSFLVGLVH